MSLLSRNPLYIGLCPDRLILCADRRKSRSASVEKETLIVQSSPDFSHWQTAIDALPSAFAASRLAKPDVTCILSNSFVRYALLPWNATLKRPAEWLALARHRLATVYGKPASAWAIRVTETGPNGPRIATATEQALMDALEKKMAECGADLVSVQPYLMAAFNGIQATMGGSSWLVIEEPGRLTLALIVDGTWRSIRNHRVDAGWRSMLPELIARENALLAIEPPCTRVVICTQEAFCTNLHGGFRFLRSVEVETFRESAEAT